MLRRRSAIGCGSSDACVRAAWSSGSVCCLQVRAETKKRKAPAPVIPRALPLLQPGSADYSDTMWHDSSAKLAHSYLCDDWEFYSVEIIVSFVLLSFAEYLL